MSESFLLRLAALFVGVTAGPGREGAGATQTVGAVCSLVLSVVSNG